MRGQKDRLFVAAQLFNDVVDFAPDLRIQARGGFVEKANAGVVDQRHSERQALLLPAGELAVEGIFLVIESEALEQFLESRAYFLLQSIGVALRIQPADGDLAGVERAQSLENFYSGGFARAIRAEQAKDLAFFNGKAHSAHGFHFAVALDEVLHSKDGIRHFLAPTTRG